MKILPKETELYRITGDSLEMLTVEVGNKPVFSEAGKMVYICVSVIIDFFSF